MSGFYNLSIRQGDVDWLVGHFLLTAGAPSIKKWHVAPESETVYSTHFFTTLVLKIVSAIGSSSRTSFSISLAHALVLVAVMSPSLSSSSSTTMS